MATSSLQLLEQARQAMRTGDRRRAGILINKVLKEDFANDEAWVLLHTVMGRGKTLDQFKREFTLKHFPDKSHLLQPHTPPSAEPKKKSSGLLARRSFKPKDEETEEPSSNVDRSWLKSAFDIATKRKPRGEIERIPKAPPIEQPSPPPPTRSSPPTPSPRVASPASRPSSPPIPSAGVGPQLTSKVRLIIADGSQSSRSRLEKLLQFEQNIDIVGLAFDGNDLIQLVRDKDPDIVLLDMELPILSGPEAAMEIQQITPVTQSILLAAALEPAVMREALRSGASDVLSKPLSIDAVIQSIARAQEVVLVRRQAQEAQKKRTGELSSMSTGGGLGSRAGKIITVYSPKGGVGCSLIAANLAVALKNEENRVLVVDGDLQYGSISVMFNERGTTTVLDLTPRVNEIDSKVIEEVVLTHRATDVNILCGPERAEEAEFVNVDQYAQLLSILRSEYDYIVVDTASRLSDHVLAAVEACDTLILVTSQDVPSLAKVSRFLNLMDVIGLSRSQAQMVINPFRKKIDISSDQISNHLNIPVAAVIPLDLKTVTPAVTRGEPFILERKTKTRPVVKAIYELADQLRVSEIPES